MIDQKQTNTFCLRWKGKQKRIGITGGIASGKTHIGNYFFKAKQWPILDADIYAHEALEEGTEISKTVLERYKNQIITTSKQNIQIINRKALAKIVFQNKKEKVWLEEIIHPFVNKRIHEELERFKSESVILLIIPLLFEKNYTNLCSEIIYIDCSREKQIERLKNRDKLNTDEAIQRIEAQWKPSIKKQFADLIINNCKDNNSWKEQLKKTYNF